MNHKNNKYNTPIITATVIDRITFYSKLLVIFSVSLPMIIISILLGKIFQVLRDWLPVIFHRLLIWLFSITIEFEGYYKISFYIYYLSYLSQPPHINL